MSKRRNKEKLKLKVSAYHLRDNCSEKLYDNPGDCAFEICKNGWAACMKGNIWTPVLGNVEVSFVDSHPLTGNKRAMIFCDSGSGFTEKCLEQFLQIGTSRENARSVRLGGISQKGMGRWATISLNRDCLISEPSGGFFVLTRTQRQGDVRLITFDLETFDRDNTVDSEWIDPDSTEMGPLKGVEGTFSAIVIPNPVFRNAREFRDEMAKFLPRKANLAVRLKVDGKPLSALPFASTISAVQPGAGGVEVYLEKIPEGSDGGIWICDKKTGFRVDFGPRLGARYLAEPFFLHGLTGDILVNRALEHQDTGRKKLTSKFLASDIWREAMDFLHREVADSANTLLGQSDSFGRDKVSQEMAGIVSFFNDKFGKPDFDGTEPWVFRKKPEPGSIGGGIRNPPSERQGTTKTTDDKPKPRTLPVNIDGRTFLVSRRSLGGNALAVVDMSGTVLQFDPLCKALPTQQAARQEYMTVMILAAIGAFDHDSSSGATLDYVASVRAKLLEK